MVRRPGETAEERHERVVEGMRRFANRERDVADETCAKWGCDDPHHPWSGEQPFNDWIDFHDRVCVVLTDPPDEEALQEAMRLYRLASPTFIAASIYLAARAKPTATRARPTRIRRRT